VSWEGPRGVLVPVRRAEKGEEMADIEDSSGSKPKKRGSRNLTRKSKTGGKKESFDVRLKRRGYPPPGDN